MKDKQAERRKRKRREAAMRTERQNAATLYAQYEAERKRLGLPKVPVKPDELMQMYRKTERDATVQAIMYGVIAGMYHLHHYYNWGRKKTCRAAQAIQYALEEMLSYDCVNRYIRAIYKRTGVKADLEGRIMIDE